MPAGTSRGGQGRATQRSASTPLAAGACTFGGRDQLKQLLRIVEPLLEFRSESLGRDLRGDHHVAGRGIGRNELHFVNLDGGVFDLAQGFLDLLGHVLCLGATAGEGAHQSLEILDRNLA